MSLLEAQRAIATNWLEAYQRLQQRGQPTTTRAAPAPTAALAPQPANGVEITSVFWIQTWWACHRWRPDDAWSVLLDHVRNSGRVQVHCAGSDTQDRRCGRHRVLDWEIGPSTQPGTGSVVVTCNGASTSSPIRIG